jgi:hypothetical protein
VLRKREERACIWAFEACKKREGGRAPAKSSLTLRGVGAHVFMWFGKQVMLCQIQESQECEMGHNRKVEI